MDDPEIFYEDRTGAETDDTCGMKYWWSRLEGATGIAPKDEAFALKIGRETHEDLAVVAELTDADLAPGSLNELISEITTPLTADDFLQTEKMEVLYRRLGWLAAFGLFMEPRIRQTFTTVQIEKEIILDRSPLWVGVTPDRILEHNQDHYLVYKEYKTTITAGNKWIQSWPFAIQLHIGIAAAQEELNRKVAFGQVMGLMKGDYRAGRLTHPYVWAYFNTKTQAWSYVYQRSAEWVLRPVWEYPGGVVAWVQFCGPEVAFEQFPHGAPVFLNQKMLDDWVDRRTFRQEEIHDVRERCQDDFNQRKLLFPMQTRACRPPFGDPCQFLMACWNAAVQSAPLASPEFVRRVPHHEIEGVVKQLNKEQHG